jgi:hypothetical protein
MPTGTSESAADRILGGLIKGNQQTDFQLSRRQKRSRCAGPLQSSSLALTQRIKTRPLLPSSLSLS